MKLSLLPICISIVLFFSCKKEFKEKEDIPLGDNVKEELLLIDIPTYNFKEFEKQFLNKKSKKLQVFNFWATWCRPCVKELPYFEELNKKNKDLEVVLVSLDLGTQKNKLISFVEKKKLKSKVVHLDDPDADAWISKVSPKWTGSIPATLVFNNRKRNFYEQSLSYDQLIKIITNFKNEK